MEISLNTVVPNGKNGVLLRGGAQNNTIGGTGGFTDNNFISGNTGNGVEIDGASTGNQTSGNVVEGNSIGVEIDGKVAEPNGINGVLIANGAQNNTIGGAVPGTTNIISSNIGSGVVISGTSSGPQTTGNTVESNLIGTDVTGEKALGNGQNGVVIKSGAQNNTIGGQINAQSNTISGNTHDGVDIDGTASGPQTTGNNLEGNTIGLDITGLKAIPNGGDGMLIDQGASTTTVNNFNTIAGNLGNGVDISGGVNNTIAGNEIGNFVDTVDANGQNGVLLRAGPRTTPSAARPLARKTSSPATPATA